MSVRRTKLSATAAQMMLVMEAERAGFTKGKPLKKVGMKAQDACELFFDHVRVPKAKLLGQPGMGFMLLMQEPAWERQMIAITSVAHAEVVLASTIAYIDARAQRIDGGTNETMKQVIARGFDGGASPRPPGAGQVPDLPDRCVRRRHCWASRPAPASATKGRLSGSGVGQGG